MPEEPGAAGPLDDETEAERLQRNWLEILQELRIALPGVQVLFAFLLTVPFTSRFADTTTRQRELYLGILLTAGASVAFLLAPTIQHRLLFRHGMKARIVFTASRFAIIGITLLAFALTAAVGLVADIIFGLPEAIVSSGFIGGLFVVLWYVMPLRLR
jgi:hypothetical protein